MARVVKVVAAALHNRWRSRRSRQGVTYSADKAALEEGDVLLGGAAGIGSSAATAVGYPAHQLQSGSPLPYQRHQPWHDDVRSPSSNSSSSSGGGFGGRPPRPPSSSIRWPPAGARGPAPAAGAGGGVRSGSFSWLEDAITEWQQSSSSSSSSRAPAPAGRHGETAAGGAGGLNGTARSGGGSGGVGGYSPQQVEEVKAVLRLLPVFATTVVYW
jgi:hypothetical protein